MVCSLFLGYALLTLTRSPVDDLRQLRYFGSHYFRVIYIVDGKSYTNFSGIVLVIFFLNLIFHVCFKSVFFITSVLSCDFHLFYYICGA